MSLCRYMTAVAIIWSLPLCAFSPKHCVPRFGVHQHQQHHHHRHHKSSGSGSPQVVNVVPATPKNTIFYALSITPQNNPNAQGITTFPVPLALNTSDQVSYGITYDQALKGFVLPEPGVYEVSCSLAIDHINAAQDELQPGFCTIVSSNGQPPIAIPLMISTQSGPSAQGRYVHTGRYSLPPSLVTCTQAGDRISFHILSYTEGGSEISFRDTISYIYISKVST